MQKIRQNDEVIVLAGKDRGKRGRVVRRLDEERVYVSGINMIKRHTKPNPQINRQGGIIEREAPIAISNVALVHKGDRTRVGFRDVEGKLVRWSKKHGEQIDG